MVWGPFWNCSVYANCIYCKLVFFPPSLLFSVATDHSSSCGIFVNGHFTCARFPWCDILNEIWECGQMQANKIYIVVQQTTELIRFWTNVSSIGVMTPHHFPVAGRDLPVSKGQPYSTMCLCFSRIFYFWKKNKVRQELNVLLDWRLWVCGDWIWAMWQIEPSRNSPS